AEIKNNIWYEFNEHRWVEIDQGYSLIKRINEEIVKDYLDKSLLLINETKGNKGELIKDDKFKEYKILCDISVKIRTNEFKKHIMKEASTLFYNPKFIEKLDEHRHLLGFNNGVFDLDKNEFRNGRPEDFITMSTNINYREYNENDE